MGAVMVANKDALSVILVSRDTQFEVSFFDKFDVFDVLTCIYESLKCLDLKIW